MREIRTPFSHLMLTDLGILVARALAPEIPRTPTMIGEIVDGLVELADGQPRPAVWVPGESRLSPAAWHTLVNRIGEAVDAVAMVIPGAGEGMFGAMADTVDSLMMPVRIFENEAEALRWLEQFLPGSSMNAGSDSGDAASSAGQDRG